MFEPDQDESLSASTDALTVVPLDATIQEEAFLAAKRGDYELLEVMLGPSIPAEKQEYIELSAKVAADADIQRLYAFLVYLTQKRIEELMAFKALDPDYQDFTMLNSRLANKVIETAITDQVASFQDQRSLAPEGFRELNDNPLIEIALDIDTDTVATVRKDASTMKTFLMTHGVKFAEAQRVVHFWTTPELNKALQDMWYERFAYRASKMPIEVIKNIDELEAALAKQVANCAFYKDKVDECAKIKAPIQSKLVLNENAFIARHQRQRELIEKVLNEKIHAFSNEMQAFLTYANFCLKVELEEEGYGELKGTDEHPKGRWISPNITTFKRNTLMHLAASYKRYRAMYLLHTYQLSLHAKNSDGVTPLALSGEDEAMLLKSMATYSRVVESDYLKESKQVMRDYRNHKLSILESPVKKFFYRIFKNWDVTNGRLYGEIPELLAILLEASQKLSDMEFALAVIRFSRTANRGLFKKSELYRDLMDLVMKFFMEPGYGVKLEEEIVAFMRLTNTDTPGGERVFEMQVVEARQTVKRLQAAIVESNGAIISLQSENDGLRNEKSEMQAAVREKDEEIVALKEALDKQAAAYQAQGEKVQSLEMKSLQQDETLAQMKADTEQLRQMVQQLMQNQIQHTPAVPIPGASVAYHTSTLYGASPESFTPSSPSDIRMSPLT